LKEFLSDDSVIDLPKPVQQLIVRAFVIPFRPKRTKKAYEQIWTPEGSPLVINSEKIARALQKKTGWDVRIAMRYQEPSIFKVIEKINKDNCEELIVVPLYPHNAMATVGSTRKEVERIVEEVNSKLKIRFVKPFFDHPAYIESLSNSIRPHLSDQMDMLLFPERQIRKADPVGTHCMSLTNCCSRHSSSVVQCYRANAFKTAELTAHKLKISKEKWRTSFQSRVSAIGPKWLTPYTSDELKHGPSNGIKNIVVACPSFICDCLETLFEIDIEGRQVFNESGGQSFRFVPCLNEDSDFIDCMENIISEMLMT
jgi:ferrochelatase